MPGYLLENRNPAFLPSFLRGSELSFCHCPSSLPSPPWLSCTASGRGICFLKSLNETCSLIPKWIALSAKRPQELLCGFFFSFGGQEPANQCLVDAWLLWYSLEQVYSKHSLPVLTHSLSPSPFLPGIIDSDDIGSLSESETKSDGKSTCSHEHPGR